MKKIIYPGRMVTVINLHLTPSTKLVCLTNGKVKQTKMSEFGVKKGLLQGLNKEDGVAHAQEA